MDAIGKAIPELPKNMQQSLRVFLPEVRNIRDAQFLVDWMKDPVKRKYPKVSLDTFLDSKKYLNLE